MSILGGGGSDVKVSLFEVDNAIFDGINNSRELRRAYRDFVDDVHDLWVRLWDLDPRGKLARETGMRHPYQTGDYKAHIKKKMPKKYKWIKTFLKKGIPIGAVYNDSDVAHFIEYGTGPDKPGSRSPWGPRTPTDEFAPMRRTAARYGAANVDTFI